MSGAGAIDGIRTLGRDDVLDVVRLARERGFVPVVGAYH